MADAQGPPGGEAPDDEVAALLRAERRRRRTRARQSFVFVAIFLVVVGIGIGAAGVNRGWWEGPFAAADDAATPAPTQACPTPTTVPVEAPGVQVSVLNSTDRPGLAGGVADELTARGLVVGAVANAPDGVVVPGTAEVRYGPEGARAAEGLASIAPGAELVRDDQRAGPAVDLVLGEAWSELAPADVPLTAVVTPDPATLPPGCATPGPTGAATPAPSTPAPATPAP
ncbi:LytR C-terminal domain-containing protein [uncultured Pseudokineococcus sp.]|uniref:LytR C-terminal domain-containing protein n=1 Tax=uncultured Pseudokineococcus sp. TaxID=1642928 RepID=UPI0026368D5C|nr:LytR C-terminal domain-containing protein [uncultured Pseudokineococcus sp.]